jgi:DNA-binding CsgD family transcriptional regulator
MLKEPVYQVRNFYNLLEKPAYLQSLESETDSLSKMLDLDVFSKTGMFFYFLIDTVKKEYTYISPSAEMITGYDSKEWMAGGFQFAFDMCHPEDRNPSQEVHRQVMIWHNELPFHLKTTCEYINNYRINHLNGHTIKILRQTRFVKIDKYGNPLIILGICQDISPFKTDDHIVLQMRGYDEVKKEKIQKETVFYPANIDIQLSERELEILNCIYKGLNIEGITEKLFISAHTVQSHRKNMLAKNDCHTMPELIYKARKQGLFA